MHFALEEKKTTSNTQTEWEKEENKNKTEQNKSDRKTSLCVLLHVAGWKFIH